MGPGELIRASALVVLADRRLLHRRAHGLVGPGQPGPDVVRRVGAAVGAVALLDWHWDLSLALLLAGAAAAVVAVVVGIPTLRLDGMFAAVTTLAFAPRRVGLPARPRRSSPGSPRASSACPTSSGVSITSQASAFELCLGVLVLVLVALHGLRHSRTGRVLRALPANQRAASGYGVRVLWAKLTAFAVSGFIAGLAGCLLLVVNQSYQETSFLVPASLVVFTATAVGGPRFGARGDPRRRHRRGQHRLPAAELAALPRRASACSSCSSSSPAGWPASATTCATGRSTRSATPPRGRDAGQPGRTVEPALAP